MGILKALFCGADITPEEEAKEKEQKRQEALRYDGARALKTGRTDIAVKCLSEALAIRPDDLESRDYLALAYLRGGQLVQALEQYQKLAKAQPSNKQLIVQAAHVAYMAEDYECMEALLAKAKDLDPGFPMTNYMLAQLRLKQHRAVEAVAHLTQAIAADESMGDARIMRGQLLLDMGDISGAAADAAFLLEHGLHEQEEVLLLSARVERSRGNADSAIQLYGKAIEANPFCADAYRERGAIYHEQGMAQKAEEDLKQLLELDPKAANVSGEYSAEGVEQKVKQAYSALNPFGL